ncbi:hypothetical protein IMZ31_18100 [Pontibacillus sp. ALD_SL1]|uniref:hypothetical protein n=1 Tax=Pontibacillus sp. ALD_SL1 TaxID=2777185 RepID=UPI001A9663EB|nr:hypothetical protein [Pontibacillus sp. ALD_SL1]QSS99946.1 hypothetical protein IMZ31_18100 [Pontibacillus sp. ALD_SL1]
MVWIGCGLSWEAAAQVLREWLKKGGDGSSFARMAQVKSITAHNFFRTAQVQKITTQDEPKRLKSSHIGSKYEDNGSS